MRFEHQQVFVAGYDAIAFAAHRCRQDIVVIWIAADLPLKLFRNNQFHSRSKQAHSFISQIRRVFKLLDQLLARFVEYEIGGEHDAQRNVQEGRGRHHAR